MTPYLEGAGAGLAAVFSWPGILIPVAGTLIAMTSSFLPGIGSSSLIAIVLILTVSWDPVSIMLLFGALTGGATFMGSITAILFNIPGSSQGAAALLDGYPLGQRGYPQTAIACAATASALGSVFGVVVLMAILPQIRPFLLSFGPFEMLLMGIWGLTTLVAIPNTSPLKGLAMCLLGFLVGMIGNDPVSGDERWTFGSTELYQGVPLVAVLLGLFTFSELIGWVKRYGLEASALAKRAPDDTTKAGIVAVFSNWLLTLRSAVIGTIVGIIPGVGGTVAGFVAYGQAAQSTKDPEARFGEGDIRGVIAPEAAMDAKDGGSLLPVIAFGIPGSEGGVILLAVLGIHGIVPGVNMLTDQLNLTYTLIFALLFSNILTSIVGVGLAPYLARLKDLRVDLIVLPALLISLICILQLNGQITDVFVAVIFGLGGYFLRRYDWPRVPFIIALVLGEFLETNLSLSIRLIELERILPFERPQALILMALTVLSLWWMGRRTMRSNKSLTVPEDFAITFWLAVGLSIMAVAAFTGGRVYSPISIFMVLASLTVVAAIAGVVWSKGSVRLSLPVPHQHRLPILCLIALPILIVTIGVVAAVAVVVLVWQVVMSDRSRSAIWRATGWAVAVGAALNFYVSHLVHLVLPDPLFLQLFS